MTRVDGNTQQESVARMFVELAWMHLGTADQFRKSFRHNSVHYTGLV
jgi:hypothetical protein